MIARLIGWSAHNLVIVLIGTAFVVAAGLYALRTLSLDAIPNSLGTNDNHPSRISASVGGRYV